MSTTVGNRSAKSAEMVAAAAKGMHLLGGTEAMRKAGEKHLPKFKIEEAEDYKARLGQSWLFNGYSKTCEDMVGMLFKKPIEIAEAPENIKEYATNIDMMGNDLSAFMAEVVKDSVRAGMSFILVDSPKLEDGTSIEDAKRQNIRPYFVHVKIEDILDWRTATVNNVQVLSHIRILETLEEQDPKDRFQSVYRSRVRVMDLIEGVVQITIYETEGTTYDKSGVSQYVSKEPYQTGMGAITIVPVYSNRKGFWKAQPLLDDLADVNIAHWQSQSDQRNILHFFRVPILFATGRNDDEPLVVKAGMAVSSASPDASLSWVSADDKPINAGRQDLKDLEFQMQVLGLQLLVAKQETATGASLDASKETTRLGLIADNIKDAVETALKWAMAYAGDSVSEISVNVNKEFGISMLTAQEVTAMLSAVNTGNLSRETFIEELKRRSFVREDLSTEDEIGRIDDEAPDLGVDFEGAA